MHKFPESVTEYVRVVTVAEPELELVQVPGDVLLGDVMEATDNAPLEQRPDTLDSVRVDVATRPLFH